MHNPEIYDHPDIFDPDRFLRNGPTGELELDPSILNPTDAAFGFGRRICPGRHLSYESLWMTIASFVTAFDIRKTRDKLGNEITPSDEYELGFLWYVLQRIGQYNDSMWTSCLVIQSLSCAKLNLALLVMQA